MKHTPGPWTPKGENIWNSDEVMYRTAKNFSIINPSQTLEANAKLISAAPDLLASLEALVGHVAHYAAMPHAHSEAYKDLAVAYAAIRKATGDAP